MISKLGSVVQKFFELQDNLSYAQQDMKRIMAAVYDKAAWSQNEGIPDKTDWTEAMAKQLRCMFRHIAQTLRRKIHPKWLQKLELVPVDAEGDMDSKETSPIKKQKTSNETEKQEQMDDHDISPAMKSMDCVQDKDMDGNDTKNKMKIYWQAEHTHTCLPITVVDRKDRTPLISLMHADSQVCQITVRTFSSHQDAVNFMIKIAKRFASGEVLKQDLHKVKLNMINSMGLHAKKKMHKKPAAKTTDNELTTEITDMEAEEQTEQHIKQNEPNAGMREAGQEEVVGITSEIPSMGMEEDMCGFIEFWTR